MTGGEFGAVEDTAGKGGDIPLAREMHGLVIMNQLGIAILIDAADEELAKQVLAPSLLRAAEGDAEQARAQGCQDA